MKPQDMTHIESFIKDAEEGGCNGYQLSDSIWCGIRSHGKDPIPYSVFLDPKVWKAVSKTRDWNQGESDDCPSCGS